MSSHFLDGWSDRVRQERKRLGYKSQAEVAELCGVRVQQWGRYEKGLSSFDGAPFRKFISLGADAQYIMTGVKATAIEQLQLQASINASTTLSEEAQHKLNQILYDNIQQRAAVVSSRQQAYEELITILNTLDDDVLVRVTQLAVDAYHARLQREKTKKN